MRELLEPMDRWQSEGRPMALVRAIQVTGFGAGQYDNCQLVTDQGERAGEVFAGLSDGELKSAVAAVFDGGEAALVHFQIGEAAAAAGGLSCGGRATLLIQSLESVPQALWDALRAGETVALASRTDVATTLVVRTTAKGTLEVSGSLNDEALHDMAVAEAQVLLADNRRNRLEFDGLAIEKIAPRTKVLAVGGGEVVEALADVTRALGWLFDAQPEGAPSVTAAAALSGADALVVTTHHPQWGPATLAAALGSTAFFVGALGSRGTQKKRAETLATAGVTDADVARIHGPVGLDLGGRSPAETALAICAEILAVRAGRDLPSLRDRGGPINA